jgi:hypothetical protein
MVHMDYEAHVTKGGSVPDVILVRKSYEEKRRKHKHRAARPWKLKHLDIEMGDERWVLAVAPACSAGLRRGCGHDVFYCLA